MMKVAPALQNPTFDGKVIIKNKITSNQNYLLNLHKPALESMIKDMPFDLFVEQSKSKKSIILSTNVENALASKVLKNNQDFVEAAELVISDAQQKMELYQKAKKAENMFNLGKNTFANIIFGNFDAARAQEKELAKMAVQDFDIYKQIPKVKISGVPLAIVQKAIINGVKYRFYKAFSKKIPEEKQFLQMKKDYHKELKAQNKKEKTVTFNMPRF